MAATLSPNEESQLLQTIEMFEVITQSQPYDYQSLEILKEAYSKLSREADVINTSRRIAQAYVHLGQLSSAILEYESILQRHPEDAEVLAALLEIENKANSLSTPAVNGEAAELDTGPGTKAASAEPAPVAPTRTKVAPADLDDGRVAMQKLFVDSKVITTGDFDLCWTTPDFRSAPGRVIEPFIQKLADRGTVLIDKSMRLICEKTRIAFLPLDKYDVDLELARSFPAETCQRWCVLPFDKMSKSILVATANPFNRQAAKELESFTTCRLLWYVAPPQDLIKAVRKAFR